MSIVTIPAERLYWAHLTADDPAATPQARRFRFEQVVPVPVESLHIIEQRHSDGGWLLIGIGIQELTSRIAAATADGAIPFRAQPACLPPHLAGAAAIDPAQVNLLVGDFEPEPVRRERQRWYMTAALALGTVVLILAAGALRRSMLLDQEADRLTARRSALLADAVRDVPGTTLPETRLTMAVRQLEQQAQGDNNAGSQEAWELLECVLAAWPADLPVQIETLTATADRCVIRGAVTGLADADRLAKALAAAPPTPDGALHADPLQVQQEGDRSLFVLTLVVARP